MNIIAREIPPIDDKYSSNFKSFVDCCLQKDPELRWDTKKLLEHKFLLHAENNLEKYQQFIEEYEAQKARDDDPFI